MKGTFSDLMPVQCCWRTKGSVSNKHIQIHSILFFPSFNVIGFVSLLVSRILTTLLGITHGNYDMYERKPGVPVNLTGVCEEENISSFMFNII